MSKSINIIGEILSIHGTDTDIPHLRLSVLEVRDRQDNSLKAKTIAYLYNGVIIPRAGDRVSLLCIDTGQMLEDNIPVYMPNKPERILFDVNMSKGNVMRFMYISAKNHKWPTGVCGEVIKHLEENSKNIADTLNDYADMQRQHCACVQLEEFLPTDKVNKLLYRWCKEFIYHRFYLYGLDMKAIYILKEHYSYVDILKFLRTDPYVLLQLSIQSVGKILNTFGWRYSTPPNRSVGEIARYIYSHLERHNSYIPMSELSDYPPEYVELLCDPHTYAFKIVDDRIYYSKALEVEQYLSKIIYKLTQVRPEAISEVTTTKLKPDQYTAMLRILNEPISILSGGAGTGKTTIIGEVVDNLIAFRKANCCILSYTGKAVRVVQHKTGFKNTMTLHRALYSDMSHVDVLIVDEISMCPTTLFARVLEHMPKLKQIILVGDHNQLPPINWCELMQPLMDFIPCMQLNINYRTSPLPGEPNVIVNEANRLIADTTKQFTFQDGSNFHVYAGDENTVLQICREALENNYTGNDCTIICPFRNDTNRLNEKVKHIFNSVNRNGRDQKWCIGDRVMVTMNIKSIDVMNGEEGTVESVDREGVHVCINSNTHLFKYKDTDNTEDTDMLTNKPMERHLLHSWAITAHKSQGSEWPVVIAYIPRYSHFITRNIIYVMLTRATEWLYLIGDLNDINKCCNNIPPKGRSTLHTFYKQLTHGDKC
jgi:hypothetical protein